ncbi:MAG: MnmC family methyltransferase [Candidatus Melainabacteria bacterium]|nr:MnmC family methyltransferase [Candidatus Melainabacteria bacterium]
MYLPNVLWHQTEDLSWSCLDPVSKECQHNQAGAYTEARLHYVAPSGWEEALKRSGHLRVLDVCFGLGYNTWTLIQSVLQWVSSPFATVDQSNGPLRVSIIGLEQDIRLQDAWPIILDQPTLADLNGLKRSFEHNKYYRTLEGPLTLTLDLPAITVFLTIFFGDFRAMLPLLAAPVDVIFHDAFSPARQPGLWSAEIFQQYRRLLRPGGRLLSYSTAHAVWGGLQEAGFHLYQSVPVGGKRGGTVASLQPIAPLWLEVEALQPLAASTHQRLQGPAGVPYRCALTEQPPADALRMRRAQEQRTR